jgi:cyanate permease
MLIVNVVDTYLSMWLPVTLKERGLSMTQIGVELAVREFVVSLISAILWGLIIAAIFSRRREKDSLSAASG